MLLRLRPLRFVAAVALALSMVGQGTWVLAGTTGSLSGTVTDSSTHAPLANAKVTATSPSQTISATTDASGHFNFLALPPDTYTITVTRPGYETVQQPGETVVADNATNASLTLGKALQTIGKVTSRSATELVKPGTTADVYSVNATQQEKASVFGGGGTLNSAFSALSSVPGVFVAPGQAGYIGAGSGLSIRGGDYDQIGYEVDGVPVNRAFDNYPSGPASSLGQQEVQVYTGSAPASAEAQGLSGFINQVIKTGTQPDTTTLTGAIGGPAYYHKFSIETTGASNNRNFSYYVGLGGYNQDFRYVDQFNGAGISQLYGTPLAPCTPDLSPALAPSCYTGGLYNGNTGAGAFVLGPANAFAQSTVADRDSVVNFHFGFPHKNGTKDDLQLLYVNNFINTQFYDSPDDLGGDAYLNAIGIGAPTYATGLAYNGATGVALPANYANLISTQTFPSAGATVANGGLIPANTRDGVNNNQGIFKAQFTKALGENAIFKLYGYTYYSNWIYNSPNSYYADYYGNPLDYELSSHTRGLSGQLTDQVTSNDLVTFQGAYTTATTTRDNNSFYAVGNRSKFAYIVNSAAPTSGACYSIAGAQLPCTAAGASATFGQAASGAIAPFAPGTVCGSGPCEYLVAENGLHATYNTVRPNFYSGSLTNQFKPTNKLTLDLGIRFDRFEYDGSNTDTGPARTFFYNSYNNEHCVSPTGVLSTRAPGAACAAGTAAANFTNPSGTVVEGYNEYQPRFGLTYSLNPATVFRASYGRFAQAPNSAFQQYTLLQNNAPATLYGTYGFQKFGFTTPDHTVVPPTSDNLDFSLEHQFGPDTSVKVTPFLRVTQNQIQQFYLNQQTNFVSGLNVGRQTSRGVEFELDKGNFARDGLAAKLSFAYTNSYVKYQQLSNGTSIIDPLNTQIKQYNAYTSFCATHPTAAPCAGGTTANGVAAAPCYTPATYDAKGNLVTVGAPLAAAACGAGDIANPYWNAPVQGLLDPNGNYPTFDLFPAGIGTAVNSYGVPYVATLLVQYKKSRLAVTPAVQFFGGQRYGAPAATLGVAPEACAAGGTALDPVRYPYGGAGGTGFDYTSCGGNTLSGGIPDPATAKFDTLGAFVAPSQLQLHLQISYDITPRLSLVTNFANIYRNCFGGTKTSFTVPGACAYGVVANGASGGVGNTFNPGSAIQPYTAQPYAPFFGSSSPFGVYVNLQAKI